MSQKNIKLFRVTTVDISLDKLLKGQLRYLNEHFQVTGVSADTGLIKGVAEREGIRTITIPMHREISLAADVKSLFALYRLFRREKPDIVHANTPKGSLLAMVAAWAARVPHRIYTVTGLRYQGATGLFRMILKTMERLSCAFANKVIPEGKGVMRTLHEDYITRKPLAVLHNGNINGIDTTAFSPDALDVSREEMRRRLELTDNDFVFVFVGRIVKDKGMNELADAMRHLQDTPTRRLKLLLVGDFETELDSLVSGNEDFFRTNERVRFVGWQDDVRPYLLAADALVFPSYREGFPNVVMQAGAMGLPSIVTNINGCNEIIIEGQNGIIIPPQDEAALESAMRRFLTEPADVSRMAASARGMIQSRYEQKDVWKALLDMYLQELGGDK